MLHNLLFFMALTLIISSALCQPTDADVFSLHTDDIDKISQVNLLPVFQFLKGEESRRLSFDNNGLKLKAVHFHHRPEKLQNTTSMTHGKRQGYSKCAKAGCATMNDYQWNNEEQPKELPGPICTQINNYLLASVELATMVFYFDNAICKGNRPCNLVGGGTIEVPASSEISRLALLRRCWTRMIDIGSWSCGEVGGTVTCGLPDLKGRISYFLYPESPSVPHKCDQMGGWPGPINCGHVNCNGAKGFCNGN